MPEPITIEVTAEDIHEGRKCNGENCPIARAASRVVPVPEGTMMFVHPTVIRVVERRHFPGTRRGVVGIYPLPHAARRFIVHFDSPVGHPDRAKCKPFAFEVRNTIV